MLNRMILRSGVLLMIAAVLSLFLQGSQSFHILHPFRRRLCGIQQQASITRPSASLPLISSSKEVRIRPSRSATREDDDATQQGPSGNDFFSAEAASEGLAEAQERYAQARARRERFLMESQKSFQALADKYDANFQDLVAEEERAAQSLERRAAEVKSVKQEMTALVKEADEVYGKGPARWMASFDIVQALSLMIVLDTFYVSYLTYRGSGPLATSLSTELILGAVLYYKIKQREAEQEAKEAAKGGGSSSSNSNGRRYP